MAIKEIAKGTILDKSNTLTFIMRGLVKASFDGGEIVLKNQDIAGLIEIGSDNDIVTYEAMDKCAVVEYEYDPNNFGDFIEEHKDVRKFAIKSIFRQVNEIISQYKLLRNEYASLKSYLTGAYEDYVYYCEQTKISPGDLPKYEETMSFILDDALPRWMPGFYADFEEMISGSDVNALSGDYLSGLICKVSADIVAMAITCSEINRIKGDLNALIINEQANDILELYLSLYLKLMKKLGPDDDNTGAIYRNISDIVMQAEGQGLDKEDFYAARMESYNSVMQKASEIADGRAQQASSVGGECFAAISGSLEAILSYIDADKELTDSFKEHVETYKNTVNKNGPSEELRALRASIVKEFNDLYIIAFKKSVLDEDVPLLMQMFFNFGYVDEELSGIENAAYLYRMVADGIPSDPSNNVYSYYEWLVNIYDNKKDPGRNEFDVDYAEHLHELQRNKEITKEEEKRFFTKSVARVSYELENVFPSVNKTTTGRITTFCPLFSDHNIVKDLESMLVTAELVKSGIDKICSIDFGAYYRQTMYSNPEQGVAKEYIDVEVRPDIILVPNIGNRGIMWQEIEGKKRTTPARMFISIFQQEDLYLQLLRLTGQFRWEMCKRVQGARWNDITDRSLTSEYFDYIQYYRKNKELSTEAKEKIKNDLVRSKNSFREMFIRDYITWIQFESTGSPRLNKVVRGIMFGYIPFAAGIRGKLCINPMYRELMERYNFKQKAKLHRLDGLIRKIGSQGIEVPDELIEQKAYYNK